MTAREWPEEHARAWLLRTAADFVKDGNLEDEVQRLLQHAAAMSSAWTTETGFRYVLADALSWKAKEIEPAVEAIYAAAQDPTLKTGATGGLWRKSGIAGGKYLVQRRDGTVPEWPSFVLGARDPAAPAALRAYANEAHRLGFAGDYVVDVLELANDFEVYGETHGKGDPDGVPHRKDDPAIVAKMLKGGNS